MKYKLLKIDDYWLITSNENGKTAKPLDINYSEYGVGKLYDNGYVQFEENSVLLPLIKNYKKVIASQNPEHNLPNITFSDEVAKELGIVDVMEKSLIVISGGLKPLNSVGGKGLSHHISYEPKIENNPVKVIKIIK